MPGMGTSGAQSGHRIPFRPPRRPGPLDIAWDWRWEIGATSIVAFFSILIAISLGTVGLIATTGAGLAALGTMLCWPPARKRIIARWWWLMTPHRIRLGCTRGWIQTFDGRLPTVLSCTPTGYGERVKLWLPAGLSVNRLLAATEELAAACWAAEVRVTRDPCRAHRVTLEVIRAFYPQDSLPYPRLPADDLPADDLLADDLLADDKLPGRVLARHAADPTEAEEDAVKVSR